ncbi:hypothetical protein Gotur_031616 [Gossypium turneri]
MVVGASPQRALAPPCTDPKASRGTASLEARGRGARARRVVRRAAMRGRNSGGVLRDENGDWIAGDNCYFGNCSIFNAKFWSNLEGLKLSQRRGHDNIIIQSDSLEVAKAIQGSISTTLNSTLIRRIQNILSQ